MSSNLQQNWDDVNSLLSSETKDAIADLGFNFMTPVQAACIPLFLNYKDVAAEAVTGSGKTLAFVIPVMEILRRAKDTWRKDEVGAIVITPTRELAYQIDEVFHKFTSKTNGITQVLIVGGKNSNESLNRIESNGANILIVTPGRLLDLFTHVRSLAHRVKTLEVLILDEADRILDYGFEQTLRDILSYLPKQRRTGLFSATQTDEVEDLIRAGLRNPVRINVTEHDEAPSVSGSSSSLEPVVRKTPKSLDNFYSIVLSDQKYNQLLAFLKEHEQEKVLVFFSTCAAVDYFASLTALILKRITLMALHGKKAKRSELFAKFRKLERGVLFCTDVMGRGIDMPDVSWVLQFDPPSSASAFVHRCGRTARLGRHGSALLFLMPTEEPYVRFIGKNQQVPLENMNTMADVKNYTPRIQTLATKDRAIFEKGMRAFVSYVQSYAKHECNVIFRLDELNLGDVAISFGLVKLPKMPELKGKSFPNFVPIDVNTDSIPYRDKLRERQRQEKIKLKNSTQQPVKQHKKPKIAWSKQKAHTEKRKMKIAQQDQELKRKLTSKDTVCDDDDFADDARLLKKLKHGKISVQDCDHAMELGFSDTSDSDS